MRKLFSLLIMTIGFVSAVYGQNATLKGTISEGAAKDPIPYASILIEEPKKNTVTDVDGNYELSLPAGTYKITFTTLGYIDHVETITLKAGETKVYNVSLKEESLNLEEVTVTAKAERQSEATLNVERKEAATVVQKIGAQEMQRKGVSNVAQGVSKVAGVSMVGSKQIFVRGMGDRYNLVTLNGLPVPSTNPDLKVIPLDIFPTQVISDISVNKSFSVDQYGDFAGGAVNVRTRDYPESGFIQVRLQGGYNSLATGKDFNFGNRTTSARLGFDQSRNMPQEVIDARNSTARVYRTSAGSTSPFETKFTPNVAKAPLNTGVSITGGNKFKVNGGKDEIGFLASINHSNDHDVNFGQYAFYNAQLNRVFDYDFTKNTYNTNTTGLANIAYNRAGVFNIGYTFMYAHQTSDEQASYDGIDNDLGHIFSRRNTYKNYNLMVNQLSAKYEINKRNTISGAFSFNQSKAAEPDRLQNVFRVVGNSVENYTYYFSKDAISENHRFFSDLTETEYNARLDYTHILNPEAANKTIFKAGYQGKIKDRIFNARQIDMRMNFDQAVDITNVDQYLIDANLSDGRTDGTYGYDETYYPSNDYTADQMINAIYGEWTQEWNPLLKSIVGVRTEISDQNTYYKLQGDAFSRKPRVAAIPDVNILPTLTVKYTPTISQVWLFSASQTITRPSFLEITPFRYSEAFGGFETQGNPGLTNGSNVNVDLKYEYYPTPAEIIAVSAFGKYLNDPIERIIVPTSGNLYSFINTNSVFVYGLEFELNKSLYGMFGMESNTARNISFGLNTAIMHTEINIDAERYYEGLGYVRPTNLSRPMVGASPFLINADANYRAVWSESSSTLFTVVYNQFGRRLFSAGFQGVGDVYENPVPTVDLNISTTFGKKHKWILDLRCNNILNPEIIREQQSIEGVTKVVNSYQRGVDVIVRLAYRLGVD